MSRGNKGYIVAAVGWLILSGQAPSAKGVASPAPPPKEQTANATSSSTNNPQPLPVTIIESAEQAKAADRVESESRKHDAHDLDAQIRAADAAEKQVFPTWMGAILGFIGTLMILWSLMVARDANKIARDSIEGQTRPWLKIDAAPAQGFCYFLEGGVECFEYQTQMTIRNVGQSPAIDASYLTTFLFIDPTPDQLRNYVETWFYSPNAEWRDKNIFHGDVWNRKSGAIHSGAAPGNGPVNLISCVRYRTTLSNVWRFTATVYSLGYLQDDRFVLNISKMSDVSHLGRANFQEHQRCAGIAT